MLGNLNVNRNKNLFRELVSITETKLITPIYPKLICNKNKLSNCDFFFKNYKLYFEGFFDYYKDTKILNSLTKDISYIIYKNNINKFSFQF